MNAGSGKLTSFQKTIPVMRLRRRPLEFRTSARSGERSCARAGVNVDGCRRVESGVKKRYESCFRPLHLFLVTEKKKKICVEGVKKNRPQTEKTAAFKAAGSDQFHIGPCSRESPD